MPREGGIRTSNLKKQKNKLSNLSYKNCTLRDHASQEEHRKMRNKYGEDFMRAEQDHWNDFLEDISSGDILIVNQYISSPSGDGGKTRIPALTARRMPGSPDPRTQAVTNEERSKLLAKTMFPGKPETSSVPRNRDYLYQLPASSEITEEQIKCHINKLSPYKATGMDKIQNVVINKCTDISIPYLIQI
jgi:hypothetical protein